MEARGGAEEVEGNWIKKKCIVEEVERGRRKREEEGK